MPTHINTRAHALTPRGQIWHFILASKTQQFFFSLPCRRARLCGRAGKASALLTMHKAQINTPTSPLSHLHIQTGACTRMHACMHAIMTVSIIIICRAVPEARKASLNRWWVYLLVIQVGPDMFHPVAMDAFQRFCFTIWCFCMAAISKGLNLLFCAEPCAALLQCAAIKSKISGNIKTKCAHELAL